MQSKTGSRSALSSVRYMQMGALLFVAVVPYGCAISPQSSETVVIARSGGPHGGSTRVAEPSPQSEPIVAVAETPTIVKPGKPSLIWDRLRAGFALPDGRGRPQVDALLRKHRSNPVFLKRITERAQPFMHFIVEEIERRGMPLEIALLPAIESAFEAQAYSRSHAAGIWQFTPTTGRSYGLKQSWWYDGRRDVYESTRAALDYLEFLNAQFAGDWFLALAAYNAGPGTVTRAMAKNRRQGKPTDYWSLNLPPETERYLPKLLAVKAVVEDPRKSGVELCPIRDEPYFATVEFDSQFDLKVAADLAGLPAVALMELNPGYTRGATDPDGPHRLLVPKDREEQLRDGFANLAAEDMLQARHHRIANGENLRAIAKSYGVSVADLQNINRMHGTRVKAGSVLLVPPAADTSKEADTALEERIVHTVSRGETFWGIARNYGVPVKMLAKWNHRAISKSLRIGERLIVYRNQQLASSGDAS